MTRAQLQPAPRTPRSALAPAPMAAPQTITALPAVYNLSLYAGDDFYLDLVVTNPDGSDADLSTALASAQIRTQPTDDTVLATFNASVQGGNIINLHLPSDQSAQLSGICHWDVQIDTGDITTLAMGQVQVTAEVTRP